MKLLIITSEPLNPSDTLSSTFELTQAGILAKSFDTSILSVTTDRSLAFLIKSFVKAILGRSNTKFTSIFRDFKAAVNYMLFRTKRAKKHLIQGITVYEGNVYPSRSHTVFSQALNTWVKAGLNAYGAYYRENGKPDLVHAHGRFLNAGALALIMHRKYSIPFVYTEHSTYFQRKLVPSESISIIKDIIRHCAAYIAVSRSLLKHVEVAIGININKALVLSNVLDPVFESPFCEPPPIDKRFIFTNVAAMEHKKGIDILLKAFKRAFNGNERYMLNLVGSGPLITEMRQLSRDLDLEDRVHFLGSLPKDKVLEILDNSHVFALPSRVETFGVVVIESLARGRPVVATVCGGPENIVNERCGLLCEAGDVDAFASNMKKIAENYASYNLAHIREVALHHYGTKAFEDRMQKLYNSILNDLHH